ncbi:CPSF A subunit region-domain-containing protein [Limtongia smithiae]|uniref:CPSF A subunit region-domain-containing protein n=1 Tax=Limtongia smithiae TaxID=1125753 RepID=UPI0034CE97BA
MMAMFLYSFTLVPPSAAVASIIGQFSGLRHQEIVIAQGSRLHLYRPDQAAGKLVEIVSCDVYGVIRTIMPFRVAGASKDFVIVGSDSGRIAILEYKPEHTRFMKVHLETFGKTGVRRVVPGQFLAVDPKGRATMIASVEKNKLVYILNRDSAANITISSPLEAHKARQLLFDVVGLDVGYENPIFAALEVDYSECDLDPSGRAHEEVQKKLTYYELDLGLNHVVRSWTEVVDRHANFLMAVPGGADGPSGVLVCTEGFITYRHAGKPAHSVPIPRRRTPFDDPTRKRVIVSGVMHKMKAAFFFLLQTDEGDLFKLTIDYGVHGVTEMRIKYFDTTPIAKSLNILKSGFLFVAAEGGPHMFYQFEKLGDEDDEIEFLSGDYAKGPMTSYPTAYFSPRPLENLVLVDVLNSLNPLISADVSNLTGDEAPQIHALAGQGARSSFRTIQHGLDVTEIVASELPGEPTAVWTTKLTAGDEFDAYIVLSFTNGTLVLSIGETVEEVTESGFISSAPTLAVQQLGENSVVQVYPKGIRHISFEKEVTEWEAPLHSAIVAATTNSRQVVIALSTSEIVYFELDEDGQLNEYQDRQAMGAPVTAMSVGDVPEGRVRNSFLAVGCRDQTVRIISLDPENTLESLSVQGLTAPPSALRILSMPNSTLFESSQILDGNSTLYLHLGLENGVYLRAVLDSITGQLSDTQTQFLGTKAVKLFKVPMQGQPTILAISTRSWLAYMHGASFKVTPLVYEPLEFGWGFCSEQCLEGVVGVEGSNLRIFTMENLTENIKQDLIPLSYTPRRLARNPVHGIFYVVEADNNTLSSGVKEELIAQSRKEFVELPVEDFGNPRYSHKWASCVEVVDALVREKTQKIEFEDGEAAFSIAVCSFSASPKHLRGDDEDEDEEEEQERMEDGEKDVYVVVGTGRVQSLIPKKMSAGYIHVYRAINEGKTLEFVHKTELEEAPLSMSEFQGHLLVGVGRSLRIYDMGIKQLLRKAEYRSRNFTNIVSVNTSFNRVVVGDMQQSVTYLTYDKQEHRFLPFADDVVARHTTCATMLDHSTTVGGDRFGNLWVVRAGEKISRDADVDDGSHLANMRGYLDGAPSRLDLVSHFYAQDIPTSVHKTQLVPGGREVVLFTGLQGSIGVLAPFSAKEDVDFFQQLEALLRAEESISLVGRDHLVYRGVHVPVKATVDGDLCEQFVLLNADAKRKIAGELERTPREVERKIAGMRTRYAF